MNSFRIIAVLLAMSFGLQAVPAFADDVQTSSRTSNSSGDPIYDVEAPPAVSMIGDLLVARPLLIGATIIGAAAFVVSLPFTAASGSVKSAGRALVVDPGRSAFVRCLGCTTTGYQHGD